MINEGSDNGWNGLYHYYHFAAEDVLGGLTAYATVEPPVPEPDRLVVPWNMAWRDKWGINPVITEGMFKKCE